MNKKVEGGYIKVGEPYKIERLAVKILVKNGARAKYKYIYIERGKLTTYSGFKESKWRMCNLLNHLWRTIKCDTT